MIDERFSEASFRERFPDVSATRSLADELQEEINAELHEVILKKWQEIIRKLNAMGHNLRAYGEIQPGEITFRDDVQDDTGYDCKLRVACDTVISVGYRDVLSSKSNPTGERSPA